MMMHQSYGVPELVLSLVPAMDELLRLRRENDRLVRENSDLRFKVYTPNPSIAAVLEGSALTLRQGLNGKWQADIKLHEHYRTAGLEADTPEEALRNGLEHTMTCWREMERELSGEDDE